MNTKLYLGLFASSLIALAAVEGCSSDTGTASTGTGGGTTSSVTATSGTGGDAATSSSSGDATTTTTSGTGGAPMNPVPPKLGAQIDRFGRPAINTALNHTFDVDPAKGMGKDAYNKESDPSKWAALAGAEFAKNLAILDGLDTVCGNQILAGPMPVAGRYAGLAGALSDDRVYVNTAGAACTTYLAVEANATGLQANMDCGGRKLDYDVIDASYSTLAAGAFSGVGDGIPADADTKGAAFPYLTAPH
jgi:hypothetical protein